MIRMLAVAQDRPVYPVTHSSPNAVVTGQLRYRISEDIKTSLKANHSSKFPGIALAIATPGVTPELYLRRGMVIIPGITSSASLVRAIAEIDEVIAPYRLPDLNFTTPASATACSAPGASLSGAS